MGIYPCPVPEDRVRDNGEKFERGLFVCFAFATVLRKNFPNVQRLNRLSKSTKLPITGLLRHSSAISSECYQMLLGNSQRDDTGEIPQHSREAQEVAAACGQDVVGTGTMLPSQCSSDDAHLTASG
nr:protein lin-52 homolog isoform X5 [Equus asinus]